MLYGLDFGVIRCNTVSDQSVRRRQFFVHVNLDILQCAFEKLVSGIETCGSRANNRGVKIPALQGRFGGPERVNGAFRA